MFHRGLLVTLLLSSSVAFAQGGSSGTATTLLQAPATLPIIFTKTISADGSNVGGVVIAKTTQPVFLSNGTIIPNGTEVSGHRGRRLFCLRQDPICSSKALELHRFDSTTSRLLMQICL